jgi:hypothetical protein
MTRITAAKNLIAIAMKLIAASLRSGNTNTAQVVTPEQQVAKKFTTMTGTITQIDIDHDEDGKEVATIKVSGRHAWEVETAIITKPELVAKLREEGFFRSVLLRGISRSDSDALNAHFLKFV